MGKKVGGIILVFVLFTLMVYSDSREGGKKIYLGVLTRFTLLYSEKFTHETVHALLTEAMSIGLCVERKMDEDSIFVIRALCTYHFYHFDARGATDTSFNWEGRGNVITLSVGPNFNLPLIPSLDFYINLDAGLKKGAITHGEPNRSFFSENLIEEVKTDFFDAYLFFGFGLKFKWETRSVNYELMFGPKFDNMFVPFEYSKIISALNLGFKAKFL